MPIESNRVAAGSIVELNRKWYATIRLASVETCAWRCCNGDCLGRRYAAASVGGGERHSVSTIICVSVRRVGLCAAAVIAKVPSISVGVARTVGKRDNGPIGRAGFSVSSGRGTKSLIVWSDYFEMRLGATKDCSGLSMTEAKQSISSKESNKPSKTSCPCH